MTIVSIGRRAILTAAMVLPMTAHATGTPYTATLVKPVDAPRDVIAGDIAWHCEGTSCVTKSTVQNGDSLWTCHGLVEQVGQVASYGSATASFDADRLAKCNGQ